MPKAKPRNWDAVKHSSMLTDHTNDMYRRLSTGKPIEQEDRTYFINAVVDLVDALGWRQELLNRLMPSTEGAGEVRPVKADVVPASVKVPELEKKTGGIFARN